MQPDDIESSHFKYHLNQLLKDRLVEKAGRGVYKLTAKGKATVDRLSRGRVNPHLTPKVITYTLLKDTRNYYLQRKDKEPYIGLLNMVGGKVHLGESSEEAAKREVYEKTGQKIDVIKLCGITEVRISTGEDLLSHVVAYVYAADLIDASPPPENLITIPFENLVSQTDLAPDLIGIINRIESSSSLFAMNLTIDWQPS